MDGSNNQIELGIADQDRFLGIESSDSSDLLNIHLLFYIRLLWQTDGKGIIYNLN
jgi:hypothetical protein